MDLHRRSLVAFLVIFTFVAYCASSAQKVQGFENCAKDVVGLFQEAKIPILGGLCNSTLPPSSLLYSKAGLYKEYKDVVKLSKDSADISDLVRRIVKAIQLFDCYNEMVIKKRALWFIGSELSSTAFDALRGLKTSTKEFINTISKSLVYLKSLNTTLSRKPDIVKQIDVINKPCFMGGKSYKKKECEDCRKSIPGFKSKAQSMSEFKKTILKMQTTIPKKLLNYANDIFVIVAKAIRIIDKIWTCLETESDTTKCESHDKSIKLFTKSMEDMAIKGNDHVKMVKAERTKLQKNVAQLIPRVLATMDGMSRCLNLKTRVS